MFDGGMFFLLLPIMPLIWLIKKLKQEDNSEK